MTISLIMFALSVIGMTHIIVESPIMEPFRDFVKWLSNKFNDFLKLFCDFSFDFGSVVNCYQCCGTWCGFLMSMIYLDANTFWQIFACGCAGGFLANFAAILLNLMEAATVVRLPDQKNES